MTANQSSLHVSQPANQSSLNDSKPVILACQPAIQLASQPVIPVLQPSSNPCMSDNQQASQRASQASPEVNLKLVTREIWTGGTRKGVRMVLPALSPSLGFFREGKHHLWSDDEVLKVASKQLTQRKEAFTPRQGGHFNQINQLSRQSQPPVTRHSSRHS